MHFFGRNIKKFRSNRGIKKNIFFRSLFGLIALNLFFYSLQTIPLSLAITLQYTSPIFMVAFSALLIKEVPTIGQVLLFLMAFLGVIVLKKSPQEMSLLGIGIGLTAAFFAGLAYTYIRKLKDTDHSLVVVFYFPVIILVFFTPYIFLRGFEVQFKDIFLVSLMGLFSFLGQVFLTLSYQNNQGSDVGILHYVGLIYALIIGFVYFKEIPDFFQILGMLIIVVSVILNKMIVKRKKDLNVNEQ